MRPHEKWSAGRRQVSAVTAFVDGKSSIGFDRCARLVQPGAMHLPTALAAVMLDGAYAAVPVQFSAQERVIHVRWRHVGSGQAAGDRLRQT